VSWRTGAAALGLLAAGCASDKLTLLDNEEGEGTGAVAVLAPDGGETLIDRPLTEAALRDGPTRSRPVKSLKPAYAALLSSLPPKARAFPFTFALGETRIPPEQRARLEEIRNELSIRPGAQVEVVGFTDSMGDEELNNEVSRNRALAVAAELRGFGFPIAEGDVVGRGEYDARDTIGDEKADERFRRVEVIVR
jgi:outer membrane protein OmpA-like peptidoglycan-associated protein